MVVMENGSSKGSSRPRNLVAVILVARSRPGPRLVFHYPPCPESLPLLEECYPDEPDSEDDVDSEVEIEHAKTQHTSNKANNVYDSSVTKHAPNNETYPDSLLGFTEESLQKFLSPGCWSDRKKFELNLNGLTFVGHPIHADHDGSWARRHTHTDDVSRPNFHRSTTNLPSAAEKDGLESHSQAGLAITEPRAQAKANQDFTHVPESLDSRVEGLSLGTSMNSVSSTSTTIPEKLSMFHVVFVLSAHPGENLDKEVSELYLHVAKTLSKALNYCQKQTQYVGLETKKLLTLKAKARQDGSTNPHLLCAQMVESSELAWALKEVYEKISIRDIAGVRINGMEMALQIPSSAPLTKPEKNELNRHSGLLLLEDKELLLNQLAHMGASPLERFIREHTPTKSLHKQAMYLSLPVDEIISLAQHLIKWRKARAIMPLHARNTYIVGPMAPLDQLESHYVADYAKKFSVLLSLPLVLKVLGAKPIKYGMLIPSRDHRGPYMEILAYLVKYRFVEQLKTFGWLQAPATLVKKVASMEEEVNQNRRPLSVASLLSPQLRPTHDDDAISVSSERTAIPLSGIDSIRKRNDITSAPKNIENGAGNLHETVGIIANPQNLSPDDSKRLQHIRATVVDEELSDRLPSLIRHFDGESAFEQVAAAEGLKRSKFEGWLDMLQTDGFLTTFRSL